MKAVKIFLVSIFIMAISLGVRAQEKYEYANIVYQAITNGRYELYTTIDGKFTESKGKVDQGFTYYNLTPVMELINKMSQEGWELHSSNSLALMGGVGYYYYLRKKKA
ncbi:MAG: hypothetical protein JWO03_3555 [Bacteroidetes bacterium]|nr:hypothetical protein [Bacteroidota bacterium]